MSTLQTPRHRLQRPSYGAAGVSNANSPSNLSASMSVNRKASLQALTGAGADMSTPSGKDLRVGDAVNVPGDMHGVVKFIGNVDGKNGRFVGVELSRDFAGRGKNDGDVDGVSYFTTSIPGSGIFLPVHRAEKRASMNGSPNLSPSLGSFTGLRARPSDPKTPSLPSKFSQSVGPGARPSSPQFKPKRPSLPRPESPLRRPTPSLAPTPGRALSQSVRGGAPSATTPAKPNLRASTNTKPAQTPRPYSRSGSRLGNHAEVEEDTTPVAMPHPGARSSHMPSFSQSTRPGSRLGSAGGQDAEIQRLRAELSERDKRLEEQAASLSEMEASVKELSAILPVEASMPVGKGGDDVAQLRQMLREKNEKIASLTAEFDNHRADFRSTLDSLEMASTETERVYEEQKRDLLAQIADLQDVTGSREEFEAVAMQLKQLEDLVAELEEGLEESRRGEAEARGEVEFLRGEVERGRAELGREREKAAAALGESGEHPSSVVPREMEAKDDEIRGLKAIIHRLSSNPDESTNGDGRHTDETKKLQEALEESRQEKEKLEKELEQLRRDSAMSNGPPGAGTHTRTESELTATGPGNGAGRARADTVRKTFAHHSRQLHGDEVEPGASVGASGAYCEMCQTNEHDTLDCKHLATSDTTASETHAGDRGQEAIHSPGKENHEAVKGVKKGAEEKWCALCEKDGHLAFDCPEEQY